MTTLEQPAPGAGADLQQRIEEYLRECRLDGAVRVVPLTGDASDRRYFRVIRSDGQGSLVLALHPGAIEFAALPFANAAALFDQIPLPIPRILGHSDRLGIVALEDLGDVTLQAHLGAVSPAEHPALYRRAIALLVRLQRRGAELDPAPYAAYRVAFDVEKLVWELDFFVRHFVEGYRGAAVDEAARRALGAEFQQIARELAAEPRVVCHRDYHSRNLMVRGGELYIIDFQDARMGPDTYDLASLLRDSYVDLDDGQIDDLLAYFLALKGASTGAGEFRRRFDLMSLQRNLKALGTFGFQTVVRRNPVYLQYIPRTLRYVKDNLDRYERFHRLRDLLSAYVGELA